MKIYNKIVLNIFTGETLYEDSFEYTGEIAYCGKSSDSGGDQTITVRYAPYIEETHSAFLSAVQLHRGAAINDSAFDGYTAIDIDDSFFGVGYTIASFPSLYDMYGKFMAGLDIDILFSQIFQDTINASEINNLVAAESALLDDDIEANMIPRFTTGMRDINSIMSSSFVVGKAMIEDTKVKAIEKYSAELKYRMIPVAVDRWKTHLEWNKSVVMSYAEIMKLFFSAKMDIEDFNYSMIARDKLWPFTVLDYERAALGALQGATTTDKSVAGGTLASKAIGGALVGAAMGGMIGGSIAATGAGVVGSGVAAGATMGLPGAIVGGVLGLAGSLF